MEAGVSGALRRRASAVRVFKATRQRNDHDLPHGRIGITEQGEGGGQGALQLHEVSRHSGGLVARVAQTAGTRADELTRMSRPMPRVNRTVKVERRVIRRRPTCGDAAVSSKPEGDAIEV